jgi:hypothetical protein
MTSWFAHVDGCYQTKSTLSFFLFCLGMLLALKLLTFPIRNASACASCDSSQSLNTMAASHPSLCQYNSVEILTKKHEKETKADLVFLIGNHMGVSHCCQAKGNYLL